MNQLPDEIITALAEDFSWDEIFDQELMRSEFVTLLDIPEEQFPAVLCAVVEKKVEIRGGTPFEQIARDLH